MKKNLILVVLLALTMPIGILFYGCGSSADLAPVPVPTPPCSSPSTHGETSVGGNTFSLPATAIGLTAPITLASETTATSISLYVTGTATGQVRYAIYYLTSPSLLVTQTNPQAVVSNAWNTANLGNLIMPAGIYILCFDFTDPNSIVYQTYSGGIFEYEYPWSWSVFPTTFPSPSGFTQYTNVLVSMYLSTCP